MRTLLTLLAVAALTLAGCSDGSGKTDDKTGLGDDTVLDVTDTTGGIRGVVVDQAIKPIAGAIVALTGGDNTTTKDDGVFTFSGLEPGDYFLSVGKAGYRAAQVATKVEAGVAEPQVVKILLDAIATTDPYVETLKLDGFYECAYALTFITDGCDWVYRTAYDEIHPPVVPRTINKFSNTQFIFVSSDTFSIVQEAFWNDDTAPTFMVMIDQTPIDNSCDCSDTYQTIEGPPGLVSRLQRFAPDGSLNTEFRDDLGWNKLLGEMPSDVEVASRGFLPPPDDPTGYNYALNMQFQVFTTLFHNVVAPEGWTFETRDQFPIK